MAEGMGLKDNLLHVFERISVKLRAPVLISICAGLRWMDHSSRIA